MYEEAREKMPMAAVDDPGESFVAAGQEKKVKMLIQKRPVFTTNFRRLEFLGRSWGRVTKDLPLTMIRPKTSTTNCRGTRLTRGHWQVKMIGSFKNTRNNTKDTK